MKTYTRISMLVLVVVLLVGTFGVTALAKGSGGSGDSNEWGKGRYRRELTEERIERIMSRLKESDPNSYDELAKLQKEDPEKFKAELRQTMREKMRGRRGRHGDMRKPAANKEYMEWLGENYPAQAEKLRRFGDENPELFRKHMRHGRERFGKMAAGRRWNPELAKLLGEDLALKGKRDMLVAQLRTASEDEKAELSKQLEAVVAERFDLIVKRKQIEYDQLQKRLARLQQRMQKSEAELQNYKTDKDAKVKQRIEQLLGETEDFDWE